MNILINLILVIWGIVALLMILVILMQRPKSEGLGAAFGGGVTENIFGAQTTTVLTKITGWLAGIFFVLTFVLSVLYSHRASGESALSRELKKSAPAALTSPSSVGSASPTGSASPSAQATTATAGTVNSSPAASVAPSPSVSVAPSASPKPKK